VRIEITVLAGLAVGFAVMAVGLLERGITSGFRRRNIIVRGVTFTGDRAFRWGVVCIIYAMVFMVGVGAAIVLPV
jgi:hypothetical protein